MSAVNAEKIQKGFKNMNDFINEPEEMEPVEIEGTEETAGEVTDSTEETPTAETVSKFRELTSNRMKMIGQQLFQMKKIPEKRGIDYSREDVEKIFAYLRNEIDKCESEFIKKFDEKKADKFDFDFKF
jgi:hypothetical protein